MEGSEVLDAPAELLDVRRKGVDAGLVLFLVDDGLLLLPLAFEGAGEVGEVGLALGEGHAEEAVGLPLAQPGKQLGVC